MNRTIVMAFLFILLLFFSASAIQAADVNVTDFAYDGLGSDIPVLLDDENDAGFSGSEYETVKNHTGLEAQSNNVYGEYDVVLKQSNTNSVLANKEVHFVVNNKNYTAVTDSNGVAVLNLGIKPGSYNVVAYFQGDDAYECSNMTSTVKLLSTVKASDMTKYYKGSTKYSATFLDSQGKAIKNANVKITVNGKTYAQKTNSKGSASLAINLKPGTYKVTAVNPITGYKITTSFKILSTVTASDLKKVVGDSKRFSAKFLKSNGKPLANKYVKFKIKGKIYKVKTNSKGLAYLSLKSFKKGTYKIISYNIDGLSKTNTIKNYKIANTKLTSSFYTFLPNQTRIIKVKLANSIGDVSGKTVKIKIAGKTYSKKTDSTGVAKLSLSSFKKGLYKVEYQFVGNKFFKSAKTSNFVTILDTTKSNFKVKSTTDFGYGAYTPFKVALSAGGVPLIKRTVTFNFAGYAYSETTNNNGIAYVPIDLEIGNHEITYATSAKFGVEGCSDSCMISVFERNSSKVSWKCGTSFKDSSQTFKVLVTDADGNPVSGGNVELTVDYEIYYGTVGSDGYATIKAYSSLGKNNVTVEFLGNNNFLPSSTSKIVSVAVSKFGEGLNVKASGKYSSAYLKASKNCQVTNSKIKALAKSLTKGLSDKIDKAKALFNYVRDNIFYEYYYNTHKGAVNTLTSGSGNCVDQAHLLIALYRAVGFKARYVHGSCTFSDGRFGHVWTQVLIGNTWVVGDPISSSNYLGKINNWNTKTYTLYTRYTTLPF